MPYVGKLSQASPHALEVVTPTLCALTFISIRRDRISEVEIAVYTPQNTEAESRSIPSNLARLVILATTPIK